MITAPVMVEPVIGWDHEPAAPLVDQRSQRSALLDVARGAALLCMALYHLAWDLHFFGLSPTDPVGDPLWRTFGHAVGAAFLILSGIGLVLAEEAGQTALHALRRLARIAAVAGGITGASLILAPSSPITFGILHCIAATNTLALPFRRSRLRVLLGLAVVSASLPLFFGGALPSTRGWAWIGLSQDVPATLDYRPLLPWLAAVFIGIALARSKPLRTWPIAQDMPIFLDGLRLAGRHSLAIYVGHQPVIFAVLAATIWLQAGVLPSGRGLGGSRFESECQAACVSAKSTEALCRAACRCAASRLSSDRRLRASTPVPGPDVSIVGLAEACRAEAQQTLR